MTFLACFKWIVIFLRFVSFLLCTFTHSSQPNQTASICINGFVINFISNTKKQLKLINYFKIRVSNESRFNLKFRLWLIFDLSTSVHVYDGQWASDLFSVTKTNSPWCGTVCVILKRIKNITIFQINGIFYSALFFMAEQN